MFFSHEYTTESAFFAPQDLSLADQSQAHLSQQMYVPYFARAKVTKLKIAALAEATYGSHPLLLQLLLLNADASHDRRYMEDMMLRYDSYGWPSFELGLGPSKMDVPLVGDMPKSSSSQYGLKAQEDIDPRETRVTNAPMR